MNKKNFFAHALIIPALYFILAISSAQADDILPSSGLTQAENRDYAIGTKLLVDKYNKQIGRMVTSSIVTLPSSFDWGPLARNPLHRTITNPVRDQMDCGSCWAFASTALLEAYTNYLYGDTMDLSEEVLVADCCRAGNCEGGYLDKASDWMVSIGTTSEECWPYTASNGPCSGYRSNPSMVKTKHWEYACGNWWTIDINKIKQALVTHGPLVTAYDFYSDFYDYNGGVYRHEYGVHLGGHAVLLTGYIDDPDYPGDGYFIAKNSWGPAWGPYGGYFAIAYDNNCNFGIESTYYQGFVAYELN